jgi:hypothetical protein
LQKDPALTLDIRAEKSAPNQFGIYYDTYRARGATRSHCYYLCDPGGKECVKSPPVGKPWFESVPQGFDDELQALERATRNQSQRQLPAEVIDLVAKANVLLLQQSDNLENERETKRRRLVDGSNSCDTNSGCEFMETTSVSNSCGDGGNNGDNGDEAMTSGPRLPPGYNIWWDSLDANNLFNVNKDRETAVDRVWDLIAKLDGANATALSYTTIVEGYDAADHTMSEKKKVSIRMKARYLAQAYRIALDSMPQKNWRDCCKEAINRLAAVHIRYIKNSRVLEKWNVEFRQRKIFCVKSKGKGDLPAFLQAHPIVVTVMKEYGRENLSEWSRSYGNAGGLIQTLPAKCTRSMGQKIRWERCARTPVSNI